MLDPAMMGGPPPMGGAPPMGGPPPGFGGMPMGEGPPPPPSQQESAVDHLRQAIEHAQAALTSEPDDADSQALAKVIQGLYAILAQRQKEQEGLLGGGNVRALSRLSG